MDYSMFYQILIIFHAAGGFIALLAGSISIIAKKGNQWHKKSGKFFYYAMMIAGGSGIIASTLPGHHNPFLFVVGLFSIYLVLSGYRALRFKKLKHVAQLKWDRVISWSMLCVGLGMILYGVRSLWIGSAMGWVLVIFGMIGALNALQDLRAMRDIKLLRKKSLRLHIGKITGAYIAAFTAFFVTNQILPSLLSWLLPTIFGVIYITYWLRKTRIKRKPTVG